jgi:hypothetical protein
MHRSAPFFVLIGLVAVLAVACRTDVVSPSPSVAVASPPPSSGTPTPTPTPSEPLIGLATWTPLAPTGPGPSAREGHTWTADPSSGLAYLFGGQDDQGVLGDLWAYDLGADAWTKLSPAGPGPAARSGHAAVWVDGVGLVVFAGQSKSGAPLADLWAYDPDAGLWHQLAPSGDAPAARTGSCAAVGPDGRIWISHGSTGDGTASADTWAYDPSADAWSDETPSGSGPVARFGHRCWWTADGRFVLYAGEATGGVALDELWALGKPGTPDAAWTRIEGHPPIPRSQPAFDGSADPIVVVGGLGTEGAYLADVVTLDATTLAATTVGQSAEGPGGRSGAALVDDPAAERHLMFGGRDASGVLDQLWQLDLATG